MRAAQVVHNQPWFVVKILQTVVSEDEEETKMHRTMLFSGIGDVDDFMRYKSGEVFIVDAAFIVTPAHMNGTNGWKMDRLSAVWVAKEPRAPTQVAQIYETCEGVSYGISALETPVEELLNKTLRMTF
ncbi:hypothetical protein [Polaromonas sp. JS666]|uniref:hypothetical protein n=1 Tax=Polaromonas sp. (strain JS666 / ATCC BAA-500) TaxID=296591 RepID=UPI000046469B|nr:hypothetical protein [Polaromonas sp. JS666]